MRNIRMRVPQVALLLPTSIKTCRELLLGILKYVHLHGPWIVHIIEGRAGEQKLLNLKTWGCTGIIGNLDNPELIYNALAAKIPVIMVMAHPDFDNPIFAHSASRLGYIQCDHLSIGRHAADYFLERKFRHFAFVGEVNDASWSEERRVAFCDHLEQNGFSCSIYPKLSGIARKDFGVEQVELCAWLESLRKPVAILAANDVRGRQVIDTCLKAGIAVPQECAILGVDNDEIICETTTPQMSSIQMSTVKAGVEAARILEGMMLGRHRGSLQKWIITFGFSHLTTRCSTEMVQIPDRLIARAMEFIRINTSMNVTVEDLVRHLRVSRRLLETRFKVAMGRTVYAEIMRLRLERVQTMLIETAMNVETIADCCGFNSASHLGTFFHKNFGVTPAAFRRQSRNREQI